MYTFKSCTLVMLLFWYGASAELATQYKQTILDRHNQLRRDQHSTNINKLEWDDSLANEADAWMVQCDMTHQMKGWGENLAFDTLSPDHTNYTDLILSEMQAWYDEIHLYGGKGCGPQSCHYTQLVWYETNKVGCALRLCSSMRVFGSPVNLFKKKAFFFGCWYSPMGNEADDLPFIKGPACTDCLEGQTCDNGLCAGEGKETCVNKLNGCVGWAAIGDCNRKKPFMEKKCRQACGFCKASEEPACEDKSADCARYGGKYVERACTGNKQWMAENCAKTCGCGKLW